MKKKILVVDDFGSIRTFICETLGRKGYDTVGAANGKEALKILTDENQVIDLVLTDFNMPDGTGYDLLKKMKSLPATAKVPVIFLTTECNPDKMRLAKDAGLTAWIKKPYRADNFLDQISRAINTPVLVK